MFSPFCLKKNDNLSSSEDAYLLIADRVIHLELVTLPSAVYQATDSVKDWEPQQCIYVSLAM
jgi:hypothetical protein